MIVSPRALRIVGSAWLVLAFGNVVELLLSHTLLTGVDTATLFARSAVIAVIGGVLHAGCVGLTCAMAVRALVTQKRGRILLGLSAGLLAVNALVTVFGIFRILAPEPFDVPSVVWVVSGIMLYGGLFMFLLAVSRGGTPSTARRAAPWAVLAVSISVFVLSRIYQSLDYSDVPSALRWSLQVLSIAWGAVIGSASLVLAAGAAGFAERTDSVALPGSDGAAWGLRQLATAMVVRIIVGILSSVGTYLALTEGAAILPILSALVDAGLALWVIVALARYRELPPEARGEGSGLALAAAVLSIPLGLASGFITSELASAIASARRASSFWGMPSLSEMRSLQTILRVTAIGSFVAGIAGGLGLATSFRRTAEKLERQDLIDLSGRLIGLIATASGLLLLLVLGTVVLGFKTPPILLLGGALVALVVAILAMVAWIQTTLGLARALGEGQKTGGTEGGDEESGGSADEGGGASMSC